MKSQITGKSLLANFNYHPIKCIAKLSIFGTLHLMLSWDMSTAIRGGMVGVLLQNEPPPRGRIEGDQALAARGSLQPDLKQAYLCWEVAKQSRKREAFQLVLPAQLPVFQKSRHQQRKN